MKRGFIIGSIIFILLFLVIMYFVSMRSTISSNVILSIEEVPFISENTIKIENFNFEPTILKIKKGTTVEWINLDSIRHTVTTKNLILNSPLISQGETYSYTFEVEGEYDYYCVPHPYVTGRIIVE